MAQGLRRFSYRSALSALLAASLLLVSACGKSGPSQGTEPGKQAPQAMLDLERRIANNTLELFALSLESTLDQGGYQSLSSENLAEELARLTQSANAPSPGDPPSHGPKFSFVANQATGPWQVVLKVEGNTLRAAAYGSNASQPLAQRSFSINNR